ncbi:MAG: MerR family transcriptional regulator [Candidatus Marinimicrobia bacterium]|nr:MerR family transcriptional regulator [Candidatus Neomarinimicrobiota bacterium]
MELEVKKLYYSIGEVSEIAQLKPYVLRYWESEFSNLSPSKNRAGNRVYTEKDINRILEIKRLLYQERFTIEGARQYFKNNQSGGTPSATRASGSVLPADLVREKDVARQALAEVQQALADLIGLIRKEKK